MVNPLFTLMGSTSQCVYAQYVFSDILLAVSKRCKQYFLHLKYLFHRICGNSSGETFTKKNLGPTNTMIVRFNSLRFKTLDPGNGFALTVTAVPSGKILKLILFFKSITMKEFLIVFWIFQNKHNSIDNYALHIVNIFFFSLCTALLTFFLISSLCSKCNLLFGICRPIFFTLTLFMNFNLFTLFRYDKFHFLTFNYN